MLTQAATPTEARLIRERIAAAGGTDRPPVSLGPPGRPTRPAFPARRRRVRCVRLAGRRGGPDPGVGAVRRRHPAGAGAGGLAARGARRAAGGPAARRAAGPGPVPPQRAAAAAHPGPPARPGRRAGRRARHRGLAAAALGRDHRRGRLPRVRGPAGHARPGPGRVPAARAPGTRRRAWSGTRSCRRAGSGPGCAPSATGPRRRSRKPGRSSTSSPRAGAGASSTSCRPSGG